jgi:hypothetical protein
MAGEGAAFGLAAGGAAAVAPGDAVLTGEIAVLSGAAGFVPGIWPPLEATHCANFAGDVTSTAIGMKPWRAPHNSEHCPK